MNIPPRAHYYDICEVMCCAQHVEAKRLANKFFLQYQNFTQRFATELNPKLEVKIDKVWNQFCDLRRGINKCCGSDKL